MLDIVSHAKSKLELAIVNITSSDSSSNTSSSSNSHSGSGNSHDLKDARDNIIKALGILDLLTSLLQSKNDKDAKPIDICYHIDNDNNDNNSHRNSSTSNNNDNTDDNDNTNISKTIGDSTGSSGDNGSSGDGSSINSIIKHSPNQRILFENIIGNQDAKQALYENVVLPLSFSPALKKVVFAGIRKGAGNVLLHGPPGIHSDFNSPVI